VEEQPVTGSTATYPPPKGAAADGAPPSKLTRPEPEAAAEASVISLSSISDADHVGWRALLPYGTASAPFVDEDWVDAWSRSFGCCEPLLVCSWEGGRLVGLGALQSLSESWAGQRTAVIQSLTNVESPRFEFLSSRGRLDIQERLYRALCESGRWDVIRLEYLPEDSPTLRAGNTVGAALGWNRVVEETFASPWRALPRPPGAWDDGLKRKFKANLRNRERRLQTLGEVTFAVARTRTEQRAALEILYALEASGWKGERGTAIAQRAGAKVFYDGLEERTALNTWIPILSVAGRVAAAQLIRVHGRTLFLLKTAYDPAFSPYTPGQLLTARLIRYGIDNGMEALDFLSENMTWKSDWEPQLRRHYRLLLFAPSPRGRYAYWTRYGIREHAKRIPGARQFVRWLKGRGEPNEDG
jgi:CelD/BcsL family acetyltransferase involved in cellulose biosynthesis